MPQSILVVGLGNMGTALAATLLKAGHGVTVWNRTASKAAPLVASGATLAKSVGSGVAKADLILVCLSNYSDTYSVLQDCEDLRGKTIIQLTSANPSDAIAMEDWAIQKGAAYLDGAIMAFPRDVGTEGCAIIVAGSVTAWRCGEAVIMTLGPGSRYLGTNVAAPAALDGALILPTLSALIGMIHGCAILEKSGGSIIDYLDMLETGYTGAVASDLRRQGMAIVNNQFSDTEASLGVWAAATGHFLKSLEQEGVDTTFLKSISDLLHRAVNAGYADEELAAVIKIVRIENNG